MHCLTAGSQNSWQCDTRFYVPVRVLSSTLLLSALAQKGISFNLGHTNTAGLLPLVSDQEQPKVWGKYSLLIFKNQMIWNKY